MSAAGADILNGERWRVVHGDCLDVMRGLPDGCVDAVVTDPPYGLSFMAREWDQKVPGPEFWSEALRVCKPGAHIVACGGTRTFHRLVCAIEDAGWEIRDRLAWLYGTGFPKSLDVSKAIDKAAGAEREVVGSKVGTPGYSLAESNGSHKTYGRGLGNTSDPERECEITAPATEAAAQWAGYGTALKPAHEPIILARKPLAGTVAANVLAHGTGALNVDGCRVGTDGGTRKGSFPKGDSVSTYGNGINGACEIVDTGAGRWPPNLLLVHAPDCEPGRCSGGCPVRVMGEQSGELGKAGVALEPAAGTDVRNEVYGAGWRYQGRQFTHGDTGTAARFFPQFDAPFLYAAKASTAERCGSRHPTVKPVDLMRWLVRLITPPGGIVLDPFAGSGTTGEGAIREGCRTLLIEQEAEHVEDIDRRMMAATRQGELFR
jgi:hypothetical protein